MVQPPTAATRERLSQTPSSSKGSTRQTMFAEYLQHDACGLAELLRLGEISSVDLMEAAIARALAVNPQLNALCHERFSETLEIARTTKQVGPFGGMPFLLKDSVPAIRFPSSLGSHYFKGRVHAGNSEVVTRCEAAGLIPFARTTAPELLMSASTEAVANGGVTRNPWNLDHSPGGSSGGAAAAVAAGIVPIAHASDGGGSIRIPASCCGLFGLKPSRGRIPAGPFVTEFRAGLASDGFLSRSVRDTALALDAVCGTDVGAPYAAFGLEGEYFNKTLRGTNEELRIVLWRDAWGQCQIHPECLAAADRLAKICSDLGHLVEERPPMEIDFPQYLASLSRVFAAFAVTDVDARARTLGRPPLRDELEPTTWGAVDLGRSLSASDYLRALTLVQNVGREFGRYMADIDVIVTPTLTQPPPRLGVITMQTDFAFHQNLNFSYTAFLILANASGQPAASLPISQSASGLPIGAQIIGRSGRDDVLLALAAEIEQFAPWVKRVPDI
jgi:amidase